MAREAEAGGAASAAKPGSRGAPVTWRRPGGCGGRRTRCCSASPPSSPSSSTASSPAPGLLPGGLLMKIAKRNKPIYAIQIILGNAAARMGNTVLQYRWALFTCRYSTSRCSLVAAVPPCAVRTPARYSTFCSYPPEMVKEMPKKVLVKEVQRLQLALGEQTKMATISQQQCDRLKNERILCRICFERDICIVLLPCRHHVLCETCSNKCRSCPVLSSDY